MAAGLGPVKARALLVNKVTTRSLNVCHLVERQYQHEHSYQQSKEDDFRKAPNADPANKGSAGAASQEGSLPGRSYVGQTLLPAPELPTQTRWGSHQYEDGCTNYTGHGCLKQHTPAVNWCPTSVRRPAPRDADAGRLHYSAQSSVSARESAPKLSHNPIS